MSWIAKHRAGQKGRGRRCQRRLGCWQHPPRSDSYFPLIPKVATVAKTEGEVRFTSNIMLNYERAWPTLLASVATNGGDWREVSIKTIVTDLTVHKIPV